MQIIINAGGTGTRLWPYSTNEQPKQFVPLVDETSFMRKTYDRLVSEFSPKQIWVNTNIKFKQMVVESLPNDFDQSHILTEPEKRDNFPSIVSHAALVAHSTSKSEPLVFVHADHLITEKDWSKFNKALKIIADSVKNQQFEIVTAGVKPKSANTKLGYIELSAEDTQKCFDRSVKVQQFKEKPDQKTAELFLESGNFLWNLGYFSFTFDSLMDNVTRFNPEIISIVDEIYTTGEIKPESYGKLPKIAFDYAIAEKTPSLGVVGIDIDWEDIGSWEAAAKYIPEIENTDSQVQMEGKNNKAKSHIKNRKIAFIGVSDLVLVESAEGILVINPKFSSEVKKVTEYFDKEQ